MMLPAIARDGLPDSYDEWRTREPKPAPDRDWTDALWDARKALEQAAKDGGERFELCLVEAREFLEEAEALR